jgi:mono/diheme cytochrome c family protein
VNGAQLFVANCASCHSWTGQGVGASAPGAYPSLIHNSVVGASDANNLAMVILHGVTRTTKQADVLMPAFASQLTDDQVAAITNYVTRQFGNPQSTVTADQIGKLRTQQ